MGQGLAEQPLAVAAAGKQLAEVAGEHFSRGHGAAGRSLEPVGLHVFFIG